jgi:hypothetical protein
VFIGAFSELDYDARSLRASIGRACHARIVTNYRVLEADN